MSKEWLSLPNISKQHADLSERILRRYLGDAEHPLPARRVGGKWLVHKADFDAWVRGFDQAGADIDRVVEEVMRSVR